MSQPEHVISAPDVDSIYDVPVNFERDNLEKYYAKRLKFQAGQQILKPGKILSKKQKIQKRSPNWCCWKIF
jgi:CTP synthase (UTP-ammonia lyase)